MKYLFSALVVLALAGCASTSDYQQYLTMQTSIQTARANADTAKYQAVATIAGTDTTAKVVAMFLLQSAGQGQQPAYIAPPKSFADGLRDWTAILLPSLMQGYGIYANTQLGMRQSDNTTALGVSTNGTLLGIAGQIQAPAANLTVGGDGVIGAGSYTAISNSYNPAPVDNSNQGNPTDNSVIYPSPAIAP